MSAGDVIEARAVRAVESPLESARFGRTVERLTVPADSGASFSEVREAVRESAADVIAVPLPGRARRLVRTAHRPRPDRGVRRLPGVLAAARRNGPRARTSADLRVPGRPLPPRLRNPGFSVFGAYGNHALANPLSTPTRRWRGYQEWALRSAAENGCSDAGVPGRGGGGPQVAGLATLEEGIRTEILLAGVIPELQGRGLYAHLLKAVEDRTLARGAAEVVISTQGTTRGCSGRGRGTVSNRWEP